MSDSNGHHQQFGFSTGALERGDYRKAVSWMQTHSIQAIELSALRLDELEPLVNSLNDLPLDSFRYVSFHAPGSFPPEMEERVIDLLQPVCRRGWNVIVHPDVIYTPGRWACFRKHLLIENMDRRKVVGRTADELTGLFKLLPEARLCLDVAHARQLDTTLTLLWELIRKFVNSIGEIHISELDSSCRHLPMSGAAVKDYRQLLSRGSRATPVIIESMLDAHRTSLRMDEFQLAQAALEER
jgi:hypothetical protein